MWRVLLALNGELDGGWYVVDVVCELFDVLFLDDNKRIINVPGPKGWRMWGSFPELAFRTTPWKYWRLTGRPGIPSRNPPSVGRSYQAPSYMWRWHRKSGVPWSHWSERGEGTGFMNDIFLLILRGAVLLYIWKAQPNVQMLQYHESKHFFASSLFDA